MRHPLFCHWDDYLQVCNSSGCWRKNKHKLPKGWHWADNELWWMDKNQKMKKYNKKINIRKNRISNHQVIEEELIEIEEE